MNPWLLPWLWMFRTPFSGDVTQAIAPVTSWWSPQFEFNFAGNRRIEGEVVADVASYGKQLGILSEAVLELAQGERGQAIDRLEALAAEIEKIKQRHVDTLEQRARADLEQLAERDPSALQRLLDAYR